MERRAEAIEMGKGGSAMMVKKRRRWSPMTMTVSSVECKLTALLLSSLVILGHSLFNYQIKHLIRFIFFKLLLLYSL